MNCVRSHLAARLGQIYWALDGHFNKIDAVGKWDRVVEFFQVYWRRLDRVIQECGESINILER